MRTNFEGKEKFGSIQGLFFSLIYYVGLVVYAQRLLHRLITRSNPDISIQVIENEYLPTDILNLSQEGFTMAFSVINYDTGEPLVDTDHVEWRVYLDTFRDLKKIDSIPVAVQTCNETDF